MPIDSLPHAERVSAALENGIGNNSDYRDKVITHPIYLANKKQQ